MTAQAARGFILLVLAGVVLTFAYSAAITPYAAAELGCALTAAAALAGGVIIWRTR